ncbi:MAG TPA: S8 family serine peptidase [Tepidisphaeraceae bacterium]
MKSRNDALRRRQRAVMEAVEARLLLAGGGSIRGVVWNDVNNDGSLQANEPLLAGWTLYLDANHNGRLDSGETTATSASDGSYSFSNLPAGNYLIGEVVKPGWRQTLPAVAVTAQPAPPMTGNGPVAGDAATDAALRAADLSQYTPSQLDSAQGWVVGLSAGARISSVTAQSGASTSSASATIAGTYVLTFPTGVSGTQAASKLANTAGLSWFYPLIGRQQQSRRFIPNDPLFPDQWHLRNTSTGGADLDVTPAWDRYQGTGVTVAVVDEGVQYTHPDLQPNYDAADSWDFNGNDPNPIETGRFETHGTEVAGVLAARGNNGIGVSGVAPQARFAALRLTAGDSTDSMEAAALSWHRDTIAVYSNSWGPDDDGIHLEGPGQQTIAALADSVAKGRGGKGNVYVWAAGNGLQENDNVNYDGYANSRYVIAATALDDQGNQAYYAEPGTPILISAFGGGDEPGITTTDLRGFAGDDSSDYFDDFGGTSAAAPQVSGVVALMLQANPNLTWRDVKHILVDTAIKNDPTDDGWQLNGAGRWVNDKYGFGQVDADAAVQAARTWSNVAPETQVTSGTLDVNRFIPDDDPTTGVTSSVQIDRLMRVETVEVEFDADISNRGDLRVVLISPDGTQSVLAEPHGDTHADYYHWVFTSTHHWDEIAKGTWTLRVTDEQGGSVGRVNSWKLNIYGTPVVGEQYVSVTDGQSLVGVNFGNHLLAGPRVFAANFVYQSLPNRLVFSFDRDLAGGISADDFDIHNDTTDQDIVQSTIKVDYFATTRTAIVTFPGFARGLLPDGNYTARIEANDVTAANGGMLDGNGDGTGGDDFVFRFFQLRGDANRDRVVNATDVKAVLANLNQSAGATWAQGDFDGDGTVGFIDYQILEVSYGHCLPTPAASDGSDDPTVTVFSARPVEAATAASRPAPVAAPPKPVSRPSTRRDPALLLQDTPAPVPQRRR